MTHSALDVHVCIIVTEGVRCRLTRSFSATAKWLLRTLQMFETVSVSTFTLLNYADN